jgi:hypothetical protein
MLTKIRGLWRHDGDEPTPALVSRRRFLFLGGVAAAAIAIPAGLAIAASRSDFDPRDVNGFLRAMRRNGHFEKDKDWDTLPPTAYQRKYGRDLASRLEAAGPANWGEIVKLGSIHDGGPYTA